MSSNTIRLFPIPTSLAKRQAGIFFGRGDQVPPDLAAARARARGARNKSNRALSFEACRPPVRETPSTPDFSAISGVLQMHDEMSAMS